MKLVVSHQILEELKELNTKRDKSDIFRNRVQNIIRLLESYFEKPKI